MPSPKSGESREQFVERCMGDAEAVADYPDRDQRFAVCASFWERKDNQDSIDFTPPQGVRSAAKRGLKLHEDGKSGSGLEASTVRMARKLAAGEAIGEDQARKGNRFWARNERFLSEPKDSPAYVSALLWGGRPGMSWYRKLYKQLEARKNKDIFMSGNKVRVNVSSRVNNSSIRYEKRNGREVVIVPSATMPDDVVMNGVKYPAHEIQSAYMTLNRTPAPLGHPADEEGNFLPASDPEAINKYYFGAFNDNARRKDGRVYLDKVIDVARARESDMGQRVLNAIDKGEPIHTSTGLYCYVTDAEDGDGCDQIASGIVFDHDAILLDEPGAATPEQGVGMMVNKARDTAGQQINAINYKLESVDEVLSDPQKVGLIHQIKAAIKDAIAPERKTETNSNEVRMTEVTVDQFEELSAQVNELAEALDKLDIKAALNEVLEPLTEKVNAMAAKDEAAAEAKKNSLVERVVNKNLLSEELAKGASVELLEATLANAESHFAAPILGGYKANTDTPVYELPED